MENSKINYPATKNFESQIKSLLFCIIPLES